MNSIQGQKYKNNLKYKPIFQILPDNGKFIS